VRIIFIYEKNKKIKKSIKEETFLKKLKIKSSQTDSAVQKKKS
jgi:hypothetical protein